MSKDIIYIEKGSDTPFISFGSKAARNLVLGNTSLQDMSNEGMERMNMWNRGILDSETLPEVLELAERMGFVKVEWVEHDQDAGYKDTFFDPDSTIQIMREWD